MKIRFFVYLVFFTIGYTAFGQNENNENIDKELFEFIKNPLDTLDTDDKFTKVIIFDDQTWAYFDLGRPIINDSIIDSLWLNDDIHAFSSVELKDIPQEIDLLLVDSLHAFSPPTNGRKVYSRFGTRGSRQHHGVDLPLNYGDSIFAVFDGKVRIVMSSRQTGGYGNMIIIRHANGLETYYAHLSKIFVQENELVKAGELIGLGGCTGRCSGPHLHFETRYQGKYFDPERIVNFESGTLRDTLFTLKKHYLSIYSHYGQTDKQSSAASQRTYYTIKSGDTLSSIARKYGTSIDKLCKWNKMTRTTTLRIGKKIIVRD
ncbi:MAG: M23 family metallopeptidase [Bacteroidales bacterium]|nr:M23 family metallopeptidase [Bacteroidales bacterium]